MCRSLPVSLLGTNAYYVVSCNLRGSILEAPGEQNRAREIGEWANEYWVYLSFSIQYISLPLLFSLALRPLSNTRIQPDKRRLSLFLRVLNETGQSRLLQPPLCAACPPCELTVGRDKRGPWIGLQHVQFLAHRVLHPAAQLVLKQELECLNLGPRGSPKP